MISNITAYCSDFVSPIRRKTREVCVGDVVIGGNQPIVVQSMTNTLTSDISASAAQICRLAGVGCKMVRIATPTLRDVENIVMIRKKIQEQGVHVPLVADVHFSTQIALKACEVVEKVRINPGNFVDAKRFVTKDYSEKEYAQELERVRVAFLPLVQKAKKYGVALRIGANHGSLSDRIMNRFGDTPEGMVESVLEFIRMAEAESYRDIIVSMKASNPLIMIAAYRRLVARMNELDMHYPLHLGVTEAGEGEDGRVKSAIGIGSLLADGLGDTIRVSLTEPPEQEIPVAQRLITLYGSDGQNKICPNQVSCDLSARKTMHLVKPCWNAYEYKRRLSCAIQGRLWAYGKDNEVRVVTDMTAGIQFGNHLTDEFNPCLEVQSFDLATYKQFAQKLSAAKDMCAAYVRVCVSDVSHKKFEKLQVDELCIDVQTLCAEIRSAQELKSRCENRIVWLCVRQTKDIPSVVSWLRGLPQENRVGVAVKGRKLISMTRELVCRLHEANAHVPIHLHWQAEEGFSYQDVVLGASIELGSLLCDGIGDSVEISSCFPIQFNHELSFTVLQACRLRMFKADYVSCPSCGRTLFDLQNTTARIRKKTQHLRGIKIAIMGCVVNGPGEMADADFGYVGAGPGFVNLYVGRTCVVRNIPEQQADERLVDLIKEHGKWIEATEPVS